VRSNATAREGMRRAAEHNGSAYNNDDLQVIGRDG
jgi:hypothetical protein